MYVYVFINVGVHNYVGIYLLKLLNASSMISSLFYPKVVWQRIP